MVDAPEEEAIKDVQLDHEEGKTAKEDTHFDELNPRITDYKPQTASVEELKSFVLDPAIHPSLCKSAKVCHQT